MKNIPVFTTESGVASLILEEIPYKKVAYVKIQSSVTPDKLVNECVDFCYAVGAEQIYATGHAYLSKFPIHTEMIRMECSKSLLSPCDLELREIDEASAGLWCEIYNKRMADVPNAATFSSNKVRGFVSAGVCYLVYEKDQLLGIGKIQGDKVDAIATVVPGRGEEVFRSLSKLIQGDKVAVEVAVNNIPAMKMYRRLGFQIVHTISTWYCINKI